MSGQEARNADVAFVRGALAPSDIVACSSAFLHVSIARTAHARVAVRLHFPEEYPASPLLVEITQSSLPPNFERKLSQQCNDKAKQHVGEPQAQHVIEFLKDLVEHNMFVPCWKEVKQVMQLCEGKGDLSCDERAGKLRMKARNGNYRLTIDVTVSPQYPEGGVTFTFGTSTFPAHITHVFQAQAEELVRKCLIGYPPEMALKASNPIRMPPSMKKSEGGNVRLTTESVKSLKHDVAVLKQISDLRDVNATKARGGGFANSTDERREARRELRKLARSEVAADQAHEEKEREMERKELAASASASAPTVSENAQPCLLVLFKFLVEQFAYGVPDQKCIACNEDVFPADPNSPSITDQAHPRRPMRVFCGHWFHWECLNEWLTTPPFLRHCPVDERRIYHPDWTASIKNLERAWANKEARLREIGEVSEFLAMDEQFRSDTGGDDFSAFS